MTAVRPHASPRALATAPARAANRGAAVVASVPEFRVPGGRVMNDAGGQIRHLALQFGGNEYDAKVPIEVRRALLSMYATFLKELEPSTQVTVAVADGASAESVRSLVAQSGIAMPERVKVVIVPGAGGLSVWARDSMVPVLGAGDVQRIVQQQRTYACGEKDLLVPASIKTVRHEVQLARQPLVYVDGGNVMSNGCQVFVGEDSLQQTATALAERGAENASFRRRLAQHQFFRNGVELDADALDYASIARDLLEDKLGGPLSVVGQPAFHIDMVMTPIGDRTMLVASPRLARQTLASLTPETKAAVLAAAQAATGRKDEMLLDELVAANQGDEVFDELATQLQRMGYQVERVPYLEGLRDTHRLPYVTYNNSIQETFTRDGGEKVQRVFVPQFGIEPLDALGRAAYERHGFEVHGLPLSALTRFEGADRCSSNVLARADEEP